MSLNGREWASLFLLGLLLALLLSARAGRQSGRDIARLVVGWKLGGALLGLMAYTVTFVYVGRWLHLWSSDLLKPTVIWFFTTAVVLFFALNKAMDERAYFRKVAVQTVEFSVLLQFVSDLFPLSVWAEIPLQLILITVVLLPLGSPVGPQRTRLEDLSRGVLGTVGLALLAMSIIQIVRLWRDLSFPGLVAEFAFPIWATLALLPFIYCLALVASYEAAFTQMQFATEERKAPWTAKLALAIRARARLSRVRAARGPVAMAMAREATLGRSLAAFDRAMEQQREDARAAAEAEARLEGLAGVFGTDKHGRQLDQREFAGTRDALRLIASCHMGHHRNLGRYRDDLLPLLLLGNSFRRFGLPEDSDIVMQVAHDGTQWWAWRQTITGWFFGIGATTGPPDQWVYDGAEPPSGPPSRESGWWHFMDSTPVGNWD